MIFTDRIITVRKGESKINEPIIVYRGDYELEVRFTIMNSKFKFMSGTNIIESENAAYGQLAILTPYGGNIFSDVAKCNDGTVTFVLTKAMLDQIEEVGLYSFQIRLFDYNKESRVSIPPVEFGIEVREPITSEDHDNSVNNAIVGYSIAKIADALNETVPDTFDANGNYNKTYWETGDRITEGKLNKIEDAIDTINDDAAALDKRITSNFNVLSSEIDTKVGVNDKIPLANLDKNSGKIDQTYLSDDLIQQIAGDAAVNAVPADGSLTTEKYADDSVTAAKVDFMYIVGNLVDTTKLTDGFISSSSGGITASDGTAYLTTDFIPIEANKTYYITRRRKLLAYDSNKNSISSTYETATTAAGFITFDSSGYLRVTFYAEDINLSAMIAEVDNTDTIPAYTSETYARFNDKVDSIDSNKLTPINGDKIISNSITIDKLSFLDDSVNLFNPYTVVDGFLSETYGTLNSDATDNNYRTSDYIPVEKDCVYETTSIRKLVFYSQSDKSYISGFDVAISLPSYTVTAPEDGYMRITTTENRLNETMVVRDSLPIEYTPYGKSLNPGELTSINGELINANSISPTQTTFIKMGNLFDPDSEDIVLDALASGLNANPYSTAGLYGASAIIEIPISGQYVFKNVRHYFICTPTGKIVGQNETCELGVEYVETISKGYLVRFTFFQNLRYKGVYLQLGTTVDPDYLQPGYTLTDVNVVINAENVLSVDGGSINPYSIAPEKCSFIELGKNMYNKYTSTYGFYINPNGTLTTYDGYYTSDYIAIKANTDYQISRCRKIAIFDESKRPCSEYGEDVNPDSARTINIPFDGYLRISARATYNDAVQIELGSVSTEYEAYGYRLVGELDSSSVVVGGENTPHIINLSNVDRIAAIGDSYTESHYTLKGKAYLCKLSLFSDYNWENHAQSGDVYRGNLNRIRNNQAIYGSVWTDYKPTYALMISYTNDLKYMDVEQYKNDLRATIETVKGLGAIPILSTEYHTNFGSGIENALFGVANEYGLDVINILPKSTVLRGTDYAPFWGGSHPGTRTNHILSDPLDNYFKRMPRPFQSIKIFRVRETTVVDSLDDLIVNTNLERAEKFKEIMIGHSALVNPEEYDACTSSSNSKVNSEYTTIMKKNTGVSFDKYALIDIVLPATARDINNIQLNLVTSATTNVYIKNVLAEPYAAPTFYQRFDYEGEYDIQVGDTYTSSRFGTQVFTVKEVTESGGIKSILTTPTMRASGENGTLTKVTGNGADTINYYYTAVGFASDYPVGKQNVGHWQEVSGSNGTFIIEQSDLNECMDYDKLSVLVEGSESFDITDIQVIMDGKITKARPTLERHHIDLGTLPSNAQQLLAEEFVGTSDQLSKWTVVGNMTPYTPADGVLPLNCSGCVDVTADNSISQTFNYTTFASDSKRALVRVWARYFPPIFDKDTMTYPDDSIITEDSFDYAKLNLVTKIGNKEFEMTDIVGLGWKEVEFEIFLPNQASSMNIRIESLDKDIQIAKVSVIEL